MSDPASLQPVTGTARQVWELVKLWVESGDEDVWITTSGSTGEPQRIELPRAAVLASAEASLARLGGPGQWLMALPPTGIGGLQVLVRSALAGVEPVLLDEHPDLAAAIAELNAERAYASFVPTQVVRIDRVGQAELLSRFAAVLLGGAATPAPLAARLEEAGVNVVRTYGMTETSGGCVYDGAALDGVQVRIETDGRIAIAGPILHRNADEWWVTDDLGRITVNGRLEVLGRADQVALSGGVKVPLGAVERALAAIPQVSEIAVVAVPDPEWGEAVIAHVVGDLDRTTARAALTAAGHPPSWTPRMIQTHAALPLLPGGKVDRRRLADATLRDRLGMTDESQ